MRSLRTTACAALLLTVIVGCGSRAPAQLQPVAATCPAPPAPPAWTMQEPSKSLQLLDDLFSISEQGSLPTSQP